MSDEMKPCFEEECECEECALIRKLGYANGRAWAEDLLHPVVDITAKVVEGMKEKLLQKRLSGVLTPEEANKLMGMTYNLAIQQLVHLAAKLSHIHEVPLGKFVGVAAEHWDGTRPMPMGGLIPLPEGLLKDLLKRMVGGDPFRPAGEDEEGDPN